MKKRQTNSIKESVGSPEWFKHKALESLKLIEGGRVWDCSNSALIWTAEGMELYEKAQVKEGGDYKEEVTDKETQLIEIIAPEIVKSLPDNFIYIDLGPGTEHKEKFFQHASTQQGKKILYVPVDINEQALSLSKKFAQKQGISAYPIRQTFEDLFSSKDFKGLPSNPKFVSIGLTFTNYEPGDIAQILTQLAGKEGSVFITVQLRDKVDMAKVKDAYKKFRELVDIQLKLLDINPKTDISNFEVTDDVRVYYTLKNVPLHLQEKGLRIGDKLLAWKSYRYTKDNLSEALKDYDATYYDEGSEFLGAIIRKKC